MPVSEKNSDFRRFYAQSFSRHIVLAMIVGIIILLATGVLDSLFQPEVAPRMWRSRLLFFVPLLLLTLISMRGHLGRFQQPVVLLFTLFGVGALLEFGRLSEPPYHHYYNTGLVLMVMFCFVLTRLRFQWALGCSALLFVMGNLFWLNDARETTGLVVIKNFILGVTCVFSLMAAWAMESTIRRQYESQQALEHERNELLQLRDAEHKRAWLREHLDDFQLRISGDQSIASLFRITMEFLGETLAPGLAAAYYHNGERLEPMASRGLVDTDLPELTPGESLTGEAARRAKLIVIDDIPEDYPRIRSGTGATRPRQLLLCPVRFQDRALGVLELARLEPLTGEERQLLSQLAERLAQALLVAEARGVHNNVSA